MNMKASIDKTTKFINVYVGLALPPFSQSDAKGRDGSIVGRLMFYKDRPHPSFSAPYQNDLSRRSHKAGEQGHDDLR